MDILASVTDLTGYTEPLVDVANGEEKDVVNGEKTLSFLTFCSKNNEAGYALVDEGSVIQVGENEYRIKAYEQGMLGKLPFKRIQKALHVFFDISGDRQDGELSGLLNLVQIMDHVFTPTEWTYVIQGAFAAVKFDKFGNSNCLKLFQDALNAFEAEFIIDNKNKRVILKNRIGQDRDAQFRYNHNLVAVRKTVDISGVFTYIEGYGKNGLKRTYTSPHASKYPRLIKADPIHDDNIETDEAMDAKLEASLNDEPSVVIEAEIIKLYKNGLPIHEYENGDSVYMIHEKLNMDIQIRVIAFSRDPFNKNKSPKLTLSNIRDAQQNHSFSYKMAQFAQVQNQIKNVMDADGNLTLALKRLYMNTDIYADATGVWYIDPTDPNRFVHIGAGGIDVHRGLIRIEREDGHALIVDGILQHGLAIQWSNPAFQTAGVEKDGPWYCVATTNRYENIDRCTLKHDSRYVHVVVDMFTENGITGYVTFDVIQDDDTILSSSTVTETRPNTEIGQGYKKDILIDLGDPTGQLVTIYWRMYGSTDSNYVYGNVRFIEQEG